MNSTIKCRELPGEFFNDELQRQREKMLDDQSLLVSQTFEEDANRVIRARDLP